VGDVIKDSLVGAKKMALELGQEEMDFLVPMNMAGHSFRR
jgi:hypothetical protein